MKPQFFTAFLFVFQSFAGSTFYVATNGNDSWSGTIAAPFLTLAKARDTIRALNATPPTNGFVVYVRAGNYFMDSGLTLTNIDSGSASFPIVYSAYSGEHPRLIGGRKITSWSAVTNSAILARLSSSARTNAQVADLSTIPYIYPVTNWGYPRSQIGDLRGINELNFNGTPMQVARYPNTGWLSVGTVSASNVFACTNTNPFTWASTNGVLAQGYFTTDYANDAELVYKLTNQTVTLSPQVALDVGSVVAGQRYFFLNILEELDNAGKYYIDRGNSKLYFWPPTPLASGEAVFGTATNLIAVTNASYIRFSGLSFESSALDLMTIQGGQNVTVDHCTFANTAGRGLLIVNSPNSGVDHSLFYGEGRACVYVDGGNRITLTSNSNYVSSCTIHDYARLDRTYQPGVKANGVGHSVAHNLIYNSPGNGVLFNGNNNILEYNLVSNVCTEATDAGGLYTGKDWSQVGQIVRYNYVLDVKRAAGLTSIRNAGLYLDDGVGGVNAYGNAFNRCEIGVEIGGGKNITISNCVFANTIYFCVLSDQRLVQQTSLMNYLSNTLVAMPYNTSPWSNQYPYLLSYLTNTVYTPLARFDMITTCASTNSHFGDSSWIGWNPDGCMTNIAVVNCSTNATTGDSRYVNFPADNLRVATNSPLYSLNPHWTAIPFDQIGPIPEVLPMPPTNLRITKAH